MTYYRRGTVFLGMGKFKSALSDLTRVIELKPDFASVRLFHLNLSWCVQLWNDSFLISFKARMQRANILLKQGVFDQAIEDYQFIVTALNFERYLLDI